MFSVSVAVILLAHAIGGFTAELSLTLLHDAVDKVWGRRTARNASAVV